jgi:hypothetical protein
MTDSNSLALLYTWDCFFPRTKASHVMSAIFENLARTYLQPFTPNITEPTQ